MRPMSKARFPTVKSKLSDEDDVFWQFSVVLKSAFHTRETRAYSASLLVWWTRKMSWVYLSPVVDAVADSARLKDVLARHHSSPRNWRISHLDIRVCRIQGRGSKRPQEKWRSKKIILKCQSGHICENA